MARYIDAVECADAISEKLNIPLGDLVDVFAEIPTADVEEVVRCGKCKYKNASLSNCEEIYCRRFDIAKLRTTDFCSYGERG